ncbi:hypothetical protein MHJ85_04960 [Brevibacterium ravenspurgense]|uniref:hypothetical protein n=1 Tax=Brevibacterium ravenspurgense TaxID=479117 RepID=UPI001EF2CE89|nr:hypothetical protein [Brevibacterium ravenspurgense]MCG7300607.1 hypothetical protein [Brevibacterium ravenspurgense]
MNVVFAATIVLAFIALGEVASIWSRARIPGLLVAMLGVFAVAKIGIIPDTVIDDSQLLVVYSVLVTALLVHMGSLIPLPTMLKQWRSVVIALSGMAVAVLLLWALITPIFGFAHFVAGAGPLAGGIVATGITTEGLKAHDLAPSLVVLPAMVLMLQSLPAMPLTNFLLRKFAIKIRDSGELEKLAAEMKAGEEKDAQKKTLVKLPTVLVDNELFMLFVVMVGASVATALSIPTQIPSSILGLLIGIVATALGLTPQRVLEKSSSFGIAMAGVIAVVMAPLVEASVKDVLAALLPVVVILIIGVTGIVVGGLAATKLLRMRGGLGMSVALTAMYGFPADYLLTNEVARSVGRDDDERKALLDVMLPPMLVGGFTSVSAGSVVIASVLVGLL